MKKFIVGIFFIGMLLGGGNVYAESNELTVKTEPVSNEMVDYAKKNVAFYLKGLLLSNGNAEDINSYSVTAPFSLVDSHSSNKLTLFPVVKDGQIQYILYLKKEADSYVAKLSKTLVDELNELVTSDSAKGIVLISGENGNVYYERGGELTLLWETPDPENTKMFRYSPTPQIDTSKLELQEVSLEQRLDYETHGEAITEQTRGKGPSLRSTVIDKNGTRINWTITEIQGREPWCAAYAAAMILNNKNDARPTRVIDMAQWGGVGPNGKFSDELLIRYANSRGVYPRRYSHTTTWEENLTQFRKSNAVYGTWQSQARPTYWHALDFIGTYSEEYMGQKMKGYIIWNPWYNYTEIVDASPSQIKYVANSIDTYVWKNTVTNW